MLSLQTKIRKKVMAKFSNKFRKPYVWSILEVKILISKWKGGVCVCVLNSFDYFLISSLQITNPCLNVLMVIYCQCKNAQVLKIFQSSYLYLIRFGSAFIYRSSSSKHPEYLFVLKYWGAVLIAGRHLKDGDPYFKVGGTFRMTLQNSVNFFSLSNNK